MGVGIAMISMLTMLPALLAIFGRKAFWSPFLDTIPHVGQNGTDETHGRWRRIGECVAVRPRRVWVSGTLLLVVLALSVTQIDTGLTNSNSFRGDVESVEGARDPRALVPRRPLRRSTNVIVPDGAKANAVKTALEKRRDLVAQVLPAAGRARPARASTSSLRGDPFSTAAFDQTPALRRTVKAAGGSNVLVGGPTAESYDYRESATRDNFVVLPLALLVVLVILADPAALPAGAGAARRLGDPVLLRGARHGHLLLRARVRVRRHRPVAPAAQRSSSSSRWGSTTTSS